MATANFDATILNDAILIFSNAQPNSTATQDQLIAFTGLGTPGNSASIPATPGSPDPALTNAINALVSAGTIKFDGTNVTVVSPNAFVLTPTGDATVDQMLNELNVKLQAGGGTAPDTLKAFLDPLRSSGATAASVGAGALLLVNLAKLHALLHNGNTAAYVTVLKDAGAAKALAGVV